MSNRFKMDNERRQRAILMGGQDPGRKEVNWFKVKISFFLASEYMLSAILKGLSGKYELILIHPSHFLTHGSSEGPVLGT